MTLVAVASPLKKYPGLATLNWTVPPPVKAAPVPKSCSPLDSVRVVPAASRYSPVLVEALAPTMVADPDRQRPGVADCAGPGDQAGRPGARGPGPGERRPGQHVHRRARQGHAGGGRVGHQVDRPARQGEPGVEGVGRPAVVDGERAA